MYVTPEILEEDVAEAVRRLNFWINRVFDEKGLTKAELARLSGLTPQGLSYMLGGDREPKVRSLCAIARALDVDVHALLAPIPADTESITDES